MKQLRRALLAAALAVIMAATAFAAQDPAAELKSLHVQCAVDAAGSARITVTAELTVTDPVTELVLPLDQGAAKAEIAGYSAKVIRDEGVPALRLRDKAGFAGSRTYSWSYTLPGTTVKTQDGQRYALSLLPSRWAWGAEACQFTVVMPEAFSASPEFFSGYYGDVVEGNLDIQCDGTTISGRYTKALMDHESLRLELDLPEGYFPLTGGSGRGRLAADAALLLMLLSCGGYWLWRLKNGRTPVTARSLPPDGTAAGELPVLYTGDTPRFGLCIMVWASLGYLDLYQNQRGQLVLRRTMAMGNERPGHEAKILNRLFAREPVCSCGSLHFGKTGRWAERALERHWRRRLFDRQGGSLLVLYLLSAAAGCLLGVETGLGLVSGGAARVLLCLALSVLGLAAGIQVPALLRDRLYGRVREGLVRLAVLLAAALLAVLASRTREAVLALAVMAAGGFGGLFGGRRSGLGRDALAQVRGYRRFLIHVSDHQLSMALSRDPQYFYRILPYAEAVGLGRQLAKKFGDRHLEGCGYFPPETEDRETALEFYERFRQALSRMEETERRTH